MTIIIDTIKEKKKKEITYDCGDCEGTEIGERVASRLLLLKLRRPLASVACAVDRAFLILNFLFIFFVQDKSFLSREVFDFRTERQVTRG